MFFSTTFIHYYHLYSYLQNYYFFCTCVSSCECKKPSVRDARSPGTGVEGGWEGPRYGDWEPDLGSLEAQPTLLTAELSL